MNKTKLGPTQQKILLLLYAGVALGLTRSARVQIRVMRELSREWRKINRSTLNRSVAALYRSKLVHKKIHKDGTTTLVLTERGRTHALRFNLDTMKIPKPARWDGKWRVVLYDVPENMRDLRVELHSKLRVLGFFELQKSVFVFPYECKNEIEYIIEAYDARPYVRRLLVQEIDSPTLLMKRFGLQKKAHLHSFALTYT